MSILTSMQIYLSVTDIKLTDSIVKVKVCFLYVFFSQIGMKQEKSLYCWMCPITPNKTFTRPRCLCTKSAGLNNNCVGVPECRMMILEDRVTHRCEYECLCICLSVCVLVML